MSVPASESSSPVGDTQVQVGRPPQGRKSAKTVDGLVTSSKMNKTIVVEVEWLERHRRYNKYIRRQTKFKAHDEKDQAQEGDFVRISQTKPLSKTKRWRLVKVIKKTKMAKTARKSS